jgi:hypothetical protein
MQVKGVDVDQVMEEVNRAVAAPGTLLADFWKEQKVQAPNLSFIYPPYSKTLMVNLDMVSRNWEIDGEFELGSRRRFVGRLVVAFKRGTRAALRWYINPIVHQVRKFNMLVTRTLNDLANNLDETARRVAALEDSDIEERIAALERRLKELQRGEGGS